MYKPDYYVETIRNIDYDLLYDQGIRNLLFDVDNTIIPYKDKVVPEEVISFMRSLEHKGFKICLVSNSTLERIENIGKIMGLPAIGMAKKPSTKGLQRGISLLGGTKEETILIGDQFCTDLLGAKRLGIKMILVEPITEIDLFATKFFRVIEKPFKRKYTKENML